MGDGEPGTTIVRGLRILTEVAERHDTSEAIATELGLGRSEVEREVERLSDVGFLRRRGDRIELGERIERLLDGLVRRSDLVDIAEPLVEGARSRLGVPLRFVAGRPSASGDTGRVLEVPVHDAAGEVAGVLQLPVEGLASEGDALLRRELVTLAAAIARLLPRPKRRSGH